MCIFPLFSVHIFLTPALRRRLWTGSFFCCFAFANIFLFHILFSLFFFARVFGLRFRLFLFLTLFFNCISFVLFWLVWERPMIRSTLWIVASFACASGQFTACTASFFLDRSFFVIVNTFYISNMWPVWVWTRFVLSLSGVSSGFFRCRWYILMPCNISESIYIENMEVELRDLRSFKQSNLHWNCLPESIIPREDMLHMIKLIMILCVCFVVVAAFVRSFVIFAVIVNAQHQS